MLARPYEERLVTLFGRKGQQRQTNYIVARVAAVGESVVRLGQSCNASIAFGHRWSPRGPSELVEQPGPEVICMEKDWNGNDHVDFRFVVTYEEPSVLAANIVRQQRP